jgi:endonuclease/exonuclease/phosphatase family metal-dependent hydrolase
MYRWKIAKKTTLSSLFISVSFGLLILFTLSSCEKPVSIDPSQAKSQDIKVNMMTFNLPGGGGGGTFSMAGVRGGMAAVVQRPNQAARLAAISEIENQISTLKASIEKAPETDPNIATLSGDNLAAFTNQYAEERNAINQIAQTINNLRPTAPGRGGFAGSAGGLTSEFLIELASLAKSDNAEKLTSRLESLSKETQLTTARGGTGRGGAIGNQGITRPSWDERFQIVCDILRNHQPDFVGFQEITRTMLDQILAALPKYTELGVAREDGQTRGEYCAILYNKSRFMKYEDESGTFWLSETPEVAGSRNWNTSSIRICTWARFIEVSTGNAFYYYNTHLDVDSQWAREEGALLILNRIQNRSNKEPFVLTGDFNATEQEQTIKFVKGQSPMTRRNGEQATNSTPMIDTFRVLFPDQKNTRTRHDWTYSREGDKIDYIFVSPDIKVLDAKIVYDNADGKYPSDHYPVTASLSIP